MIKVFIKNIILFSLLLLYSNSFFGQLTPSLKENIDYLATYSREADKSWGDDDHIQILFIAIPKDYAKEIYISLFDPDIGGKHDQLVGYGYNSKTKFSLYGGEGCYTNADARKINPEGDFKKGTQLSSKIFGRSVMYDDQWFSFGPINPKRGEFILSLNAYILKLVVEGLDGDDGNMYRYYLSSSSYEYIPIEGVDCFSYEITCRFKQEKNSLAHFFPFIDYKTSLIKINNFDGDNQGKFQLTTSIKKSHKIELSGDNNWKVSKHEFNASEKDKYIDIQYISDGSSANDITIYLLDQSDQAIPFHCFPVDGIPKYLYKIDIQHNY